MCGIAGIISFKQQVNHLKDKLEQMCQLVDYRGPDDYGYQIYSNGILGHRRLSIIDLKSGKQPLVYTYQNKEYCIVYNGELYNMKELKQDLMIKGYKFKTSSDTEVVLVSYIEYQQQCVNYLDGIFSFVIYSDEGVFGCRDHLGVKPLFYSYNDDTLVFASEIKSILCYQEKAIVNREGILELLGLGPSVSPGKTIYKGIKSLEPGHYFYLDRNRFEIIRYFKLCAKKHIDDYQTTKAKVRQLLIKSITNQLISDVDVSTMLSGGIDSSIITAISTNYKPNINTYSVSYEDQDKYFKSYDYQTSQDEDFIQLMVDQYQTKHHYITLSQKELIHHLKTSLIARDMPGMADIDSSFYCFARRISLAHKVVLSGECADEIFGGYPWFYKEELYSKDDFPWLLDLKQRISLLNKDIAKLPIEQYVHEAYLKTLEEIEYNDDNVENNRKQKMIYLCSEWFMQTLLTRGDSQTMRASIECRVPFASKELIQYVYNIPWCYLYQNNQEKALLRDAFKEELPEEILNRKKNPYPKTHSPIYTELVCQLLEESLEDENNILFKLFDLDKIKQLIASKGQSFKYPWFGQLMMGPQLIAYLYQIYLWGNLYHIELEL